MRVLINEKFIKKLMCIFSVFIFMFSSLFFQSSAKVVVERNSDNNIRLIRCKTPEDIKRLRDALVGLRDIFSGAIMTRGYNTKVAYEGVWTFMSIEYINRYYNYEISRFLTNFILKDYRNYDKGFYTICLGDLNTCVTRVLDFIGDEDTWQYDDDDFIEIEMLVTAEQV